VLAYLNMIQSLIVTFALLTIIMLPTMILYGTGDGFGEGTEVSWYFTTPTIGNLGALESHCHAHLINLEQSENKKNTMELDCEIGKLAFVAHSGLIPKSYPVRHFCGDPSEKEEVNKCTQESMSQESVA